MNLFRSSAFQKGVIPLPLLLTVIGVMIFFIAASVLPVKDKLFSGLFPKEQSIAASNDIFPLGFFEDGSITNSPTAMQQLITFSRTNNLDSVLFTNNKVATQMPMLNVSDQQNFNVYFAPMDELQTQWFGSTMSATLANAQSVITPLVNQMKTHPSIKGYNLRDDITLPMSEKLRLAVQVFDTLDSTRSASAVFRPSTSNDAKVLDIAKSRSAITYYYPAKNSLAACEWGFSSDISNDLTQTYRDINRYKVMDTDPTYAVLQTHKTITGHPSQMLRVPTLEELSLQNWIVLGEGSKGIFWFIYSSSQGWIGVKDSPALASKISEISARTKQLIPVLTNLQKTENYFRLAGTGNKYISTLVDNKTGKYYLIIANGSCGITQDLTVSSITFQGSLKDVESGQTFNLNTPISVPAGDGRLLEVINISGTASTAVNPNLFLNPSMDSSFTSWGGPKTGAAFDTTTPQSGTGSLKITGSTSPSYASQNVPLNPGELYTVKYWVKSVGLTGKGIGMRVFSGVSTDSPSDISFTKGTVTDWTEVTETFIAPNNYTTGGRIDLYWDAKVGETAWIDNVSVCQGKNCQPKIITVSNPQPTNSISPSPTASATPSPSSSSISGVPKVSADYTKDVETWWNTHPLNPKSPNGIAIGGITQSGPVVNVKQQFNSDIQAAINSLPVSGGTLYFEPGTYTHNFQIIGKQNIHFVSDGPDAIIVGGPTTSDSLLTESTIAGCTEAITYTPFNQALFYSNNAKHAAALDCVTNQKGNFYFKNLTFDGNNLSQMAFFLRAVRDVVFDNVTFQNFVDPKAYHAGFINANSYIENIWCRGCHFKGSQRWAIMLDGVHNGGVINSTFEGYSGSGQIGFLTNDDFTIDLNKNGVFDPYEIRITNYAVVEGNQFIASSNTNISGTGANMLVKDNIQTGGSQYFARFAVKNSARQISYKYYGNVVINNQTKGVQYMSYFGGAEACPNTNFTDPTRCSWFGNFKVKGNQAQNASTFKEVAMIDVLNSDHYDSTSTIIGNNCINGLLFGSQTACPSNFPNNESSASPSPAASTIKEGDIIVNGKVDIFDYNQLLSDYGKTGTNLISDIYKTGSSLNKVDIFDYNLLLTNFGK